MLLETILTSAHQLYHLLRMQGTASNVVIIWYFHAKMGNEGKPN